MLNGTSPPIHEINASDTALGIANTENAAQYLKFFCAFVHGEEGPFAVLDSVGDLLFEEDLPDELKAQLESDLATSISPLAQKGAEEGARVFEGIVCYADTVFKAAFMAHSSGMVEMLDDTPLLSGLPLMRPKYDGPIWRLASNVKSNE